jgi:ABC-type nitrate/sulfonate/bicarbonate transport system permease component
MRHYRREQFHLNKKPLHKKAFYYAFAIAVLVVTATFLASDFTSFYPVHFFEVFQRVSFAKILLYAGYTLLRILIAYAIGLVLSLIILFTIVKFKRIENFILPVFDILQSVPVLAFFPLIIVTFAKLHLPEVAAQIILIVAAFWAILFGAIGGYHQIPQDILDAAKIYNAKGLRYFRRLLPVQSCLSANSGMLLLFRSTLAMATFKSSCPA